jgi:hypothetical protein
MSQAAGADWWWVLSLAVVAAGAMVLLCRLWLGYELERMRGLWDDIYFQLRERCHLVGELNNHLRKLLRTNPKLADDIQYLLRRMEETNDPHTHAAVQNGLVLTVQTAVEQFHRGPAFQADRDISRLMEAVEAVDSRLAPLRDRFNRSVRAYNQRLSTPPFSLAARFAQANERPLFPMLIPWWSIHSEAYGKITGDEIRQQLQSSKAPLILAPSQRVQWPVGAPMVQVSRRAQAPEPGAVERNGAGPRDGRRPR